MEKAAEESPERASFSESVAWKQGKARESVGGCPPTGRSHPTKRMFLLTSSPSATLFATITSFTSSAGGAAPTAAASAMTEASVELEARTRGDSEATLRQVDE